MMKIAALAVLAGAAVASADVFSNNTPIVIPTGAPGTTGGPSTPSTINVAFGGPVTGATVTLHGLTHTFPADLDILLVGPAGQTVMLASDQGGGTDVVLVNLTFQDGAPALPAVWVSGTYSPVSPAQSDVITGAPAGPYGTSVMSAFSANWNGVWTLYIQDDAGGDIGALEGGWSIELVPTPGAAAMLGLGGLAAMRRRRA
ncbi:MAG TPA: hypothetical protein VFF65_00090 [Phycisphaerales bacterium]|nr:hypothetical protein [Phycisphaerales bacterium]